MVSEGSELVYFIPVVQAVPIGIGVLLRYLATIVLSESSVW